MSTTPIASVGTMQAAVKTRRYRFLPPVRSDMAPRTGETAALSATDRLPATVKRKVPFVSPRKRIAHGPMAKLTIAKLKIVFAKS
jgi:hypothetical protein